MSRFFECCVRCRMTFTDEQKYNEHIAMHKGASSVYAKRKPIDEAIEMVDAQRTQVEVNSTQDVDARLESVKEVNKLRKKLINAGIESATMTPKEVQARYKAEKAKGKVK